MAAIAGTDATLGALESGQVDMLLMTTAYRAPPGWRCRSCGVVLLWECPLVCQRCGESRPSLVDVKDETVKLAERHGATIELVRDSDVMTELGGVGRLLRYQHGGRQPREDSTLEGSATGSQVRRWHQGA